MKRRKPLKQDIAEDVCELNCWRTPPRIKKVLKRDLTQDEIRSVTSVLEAYVPYAEWIKTWRKQDVGRS